MSCSSTNRSARWTPICGVDTRSAVRRLLDATGITAILVTHDHDDALGFADEVALMDAGRVVRTGPPADVYS